MNMHRSNVRFLDLPNEILFIIFKKLDNMEVLYSLYGIDHQRLDFFLQHETFAHTLNFTCTTLIDDVLPIADIMFNRFCIDILPKMNHCVRSLIVESGSMERVLLAGDYPNLTQLQIFNFDEEVVARYFTGKNRSFDVEFDIGLFDLV